MTVNASLTNVTVTGFAKAAVVKNTVDPDQHDFHTELKLPRLRIDGNYEMFGKILVIPLQGKGTCWFDASKTPFLPAKKVCAFVFGCYAWPTSRNAESCVSFISQYGFSARIGLRHDK